MLPRTKRPGPIIISPSTTCRSPADDIGRLLSLSAFLAGSMMLLMAGSLLARQGPGMTGQAISGPALVVIAVLLIASTSAIRLMVLGGDQGASWLSRLAWTSPTIAYLLIAAATSVPGIQGIGQGAPWALIVATEIGWWLAWLTRGPGGYRSTATTSIASGKTMPVNQPEDAEMIHDEPAIDDVDAELNELLPAGTTQRASRSHQDGCERLEVLMRLTFSAGQRSQFVHLPIHPPFPAVPDVTCHQLTGPACSLTVAESQSFGVRLELRLSRMPVEEVTIVVQAEVVEAQGSSAAA